MSGIETGRLIVKVIVTGEPVSKQRPRFAKNRGGGVYTPRTTSEAQARIAWTIKAGSPGIQPLQDGTFAVRVTFHTKNRQRRDLDNMCKLVFDACNKIVWRDDVQVEELFATVNRASGDPRTELEIYALPDSTPRIECLICNKQVKTYPSWPHRSFCSRPCFAVARQTGVEVPCGHCAKMIHRADNKLKHGPKTFYCSHDCLNAGSTVELSCTRCTTLFRRPKSKRKSKYSYCSNDCKFTHYKEMRAVEARGVCLDCNGETSDKRKARCWECSVKFAQPTRALALRVCSQCKQRGHYKSTCPFVEAIK